ncbi:MAG: penicillin-binding protein 1A [Alphaproteobacteria bacterium]|nr:penicillin-binding protein 1A [Alphaproteobacteria bacterium]
MFKIFTALVSAGMFFATLALVAMIVFFSKLSVELPDYRQLAKYEPAVTTRLFAGDGQLLMEYAAEKRLFVPVDKIPARVKQAFIAAEDKHFYSHGGIDFIGIARAIINNLKNLGKGRRPAGASTITQQVAKNFLLSSEVSYIRKIKEAILAHRMNKAFTKDHVLELYLNEIYLGNRSYGVAAAALNYFNKSLDELTLEEIGYLAALPKGPNNYHPKKKYDAAVARRNWVIGRMVEDGYVTKEEADIAKSKPLVTTDRKTGFLKDAEYYSEEVRRTISHNLGDDALYEGGLIVRTTINPQIQSMATKAFRKGLIDYDIRHGYKGATHKIIIDENYKKSLDDVVLEKGAQPTWQKAVVLEVEKSKAKIETDDELTAHIYLEDIAWARPRLKNNGIGAVPTDVSKVLNVGDVIYVEKLDNSKTKNDDAYALRQVPDVEGAMVVIDPHTGKVLALVGGFDFKKSQFNRATQAYRQTGSSFKPFVYLTALEMGYSPNDLILDAPFVLDQGVGQPKWKPANYSKKFYGLMTLRQGIEQSKNLMTVRLAQDIGMDKVAEMTKRVGINDNLPQYLSSSLGSADARVLDMTSAYAIIVNGGKKVSPHLIERIQDRSGKTIYKYDEFDCMECYADKWENQEAPIKPDLREQIIDPLTAYQMTSILEGVAVRGTGAKLRSLNKHLAGKTGTTNDNKDAWFIGFSPDLVAGIYVGYDEPVSLGRYETGASAALPIFYDFMKEALKDVPDYDFRIPAGIKLVRINPKTGKLSEPTDKTVIVEAIKPDYSFDASKQRVVGKDKEDMMIIDNQDNGLQVGGEY